MPDGDTIRGLNRLYQKPYEALSEGKATNDECARSLIKALHQDIQRKGNIPVMLAKSMGESLAHAIDDAGGIIFVNWAGLRLEFNRLKEQSEGPPYLKDLVLRAGRSVLHDLEHGQESSINCPSEAILCRYMTEVYEASFKECVPCESEEAVLERLEQIEPNVLTAIHDWAKKADADESVKKLRLRSLPKVKEADNLDDDLLAAHNHINSRKIDEILQTNPSGLSITDQYLKQHLPACDGAPI